MAAVRLLYQIVVDRNPQGLIRIAAVQRDLHGKSARSELAECPWLNEGLVREPEHSSGCSSETCQRRRHQRMLRPKLVSRKLLHNA